MDQKNTEQVSKDRGGWKNDIIPGCCFLMYLSNGVAVYGEVLRLDDEKPGFFYARCFTSHFPEGYQGRIHGVDVALLLSKEQLDEARRRSWPSAELSVRSILFMPPN